MDPYLDDNDALEALSTDISVLSLEDILNSQTSNARSQSQLKPVCKLNERDIPGEDVFHMDLERMDTSIAKNIDSLIYKLNHYLSDDCETSKELTELCRNIKKLKSGPEKAELSFALIGMSGVGKSTIINALLHRLNLSGTSGGTKACTHFANIYKWKEGAPDDANESDIAIRFSTASDRKRTISDYVLYYGRVHHFAHFVKGCNPRSKDDYSEEITEGEKVLAEEALEYFRVSFNSSKGGRAARTLRNFLRSPLQLSNGSFKSACLAAQESLLKELGAEEECVTYLDVPDKLPPEASIGAIDIETVREKAESLWCLVESVTFATGALMLRHGLVLIDIPGYNDMNRKRIASADVHRRNADGEIVVGRAVRFEDDDFVRHHVSRSRSAHGDENTFLVMNHIDDQNCFKIDAREVLTEWLERAENDERPFIDLVSALSAEQANRESNRTGYAQTLTNRAYAALQRLRAHQVTERETEKNGGNISVIALNAASYCLWMDENRSADPAFGPRMSGVPHLRNILLSRIAKLKLKAYKKHYFDVLSHVGVMCRRFINKISGDKVGTRTCRESLGSRFDAAIEAAGNAVESILNRPLAKSMFRVTEKEKINTLIKALIEKHWGSSTGTDAVMWGTWQHTLMCGGIPDRYGSKAYRHRRYVNWNRDLLGTFEKPKHVEHAFATRKAHVSKWRKELVDRSQGFANSIAGPITRLWDVDDGVREVITLSSLGSSLKAPIRIEWNNVRRSIEKDVEAFPATLVSAITAVYRQITTEDVYGTIADLNKAAYKAAFSVRRGRGVYKRQRECLFNNLTDPSPTILPKHKNLLDMYEQKALELVRHRIQNTADEFLDSVTIKLNDFAYSIEGFVTSEPSETSKHKKARKIVELWLITFSNVLDMCRREFRTIDQERDVLITGSAKRRNETRQSDSPMKKIKLEDGGTPPLR